MRLLLACILVTLFSAGGFAQPSDSDLELLGEFNYGAFMVDGPINLKADKAVYLSDGGMLLLGSGLNQFQDQQAYAWKIDADGNLLWSIDDGNELSGDAYTDAVEVNGSIYLTLNIDVFGDFDRQAWLYRYDLDGNLEGLVQLEDPSGNPIQVNAIATGPNNSLIVGGITYPPNALGTGWVRRLSAALTPVGTFETNLGSQVLDLFDNGSGFYSILSSVNNIPEEGCPGFEFTFSGDLFLERRNSNFELDFAFVIGGVTQDEFIDAEVSPDGRVGILGATYCLANTGNTGPLNVARINGSLRPYWVAEVDVIGETATTAIALPGGLPVFGQSYEAPVALVPSACSPNGWMVLAELNNLNGTNNQYLDIYDPVAGSSENRLIYTESNFETRLCDLARGAEDNFYLAGTGGQPGGGQYLMLQLVEGDGCEFPAVGCDESEEINCTDGFTLFRNNFEADNSLDSGNYGCANAGSEHDGPDQVYRFEAIPGRDFTATLLSNGIDLNLFVFAECPLDAGTGPLTCVFNSQNTLEADGTNFENIYIDNLPPGTYYLVVDGRTSDDVGEYELTLNCATGFVCDFGFFAPWDTLGCGMIVSANNVLSQGVSNGVSNYCGSVGTTSNSANTGLTGPEKFFHVNIYENGLYTFTVTPNTSELELDAFLFTGGDGLLDDIFVNDLCGAYTNCLVSSSGQGPGLTETFTVALEAGENYVMVIDGKFGSEGTFTVGMTCEPPPCDLIGYNIACDDLSWYTQPSGNYVFTSTDAAFTTTFEWQINGLPVSETGLSWDVSANQLFIDLSGVNGGSYEVCAPFLNEEGCVNYCCQVICDNTLIEPYTLDFSFTDGGFDFEISGDGVTQPSWFYFEDGETEPTDFGSGFNAFLFAPNTCEIRTIYARFFDITTQCWRTVSEEFFLCDPFQCDEVSGIFNSSTNDWIITLNDPGAGFIQWRDDDALTNFSETSNQLTLNFDNECRTRTITVRYRDGNGVRRICCLRFFFCDPYDCADITDTYNEDDNSYFLGAAVLFGPGPIVWYDDDTNQPLGNGITVTLPFDGECRTRNISVRYFDPNGVFRICCHTFEFCVEDECDDPVFSEDCGDLEFYAVDQFNYYFATDNGDFIDADLNPVADWVINGQSAEDLGLSAVMTINLNGPETLEIEFTPEQSDEYQICYPVLDDNGCVNYCCETFCINVIVEPYVVDFSYNAGENGFDLSLSGAGVSQTSWYYFPDGATEPTELGTGNNAFIDLTDECEVVTVFARYFDTSSNCWRVISEDLFLCDPYACDEIDLTYDFANNAYNIFWNAPADATDVVWVDDVTGD
ncbi:MAG: hypothetical protein WBA17_18665, partial [Saprospiraceae bacterium]